MDYDNLAKTEKDVITAWLLILLIIAIIFGPLVTIWSVNNLFGFNIAYTLTNWFASFWLTGLLASKAISSKPPTSPTN